MKKNYSKPATEFILIKVEKHLLTGSDDGVRATMSGYGEDENEGGFRQRKRRDYAE